MSENPTFAIQRKYILGLGKWLQTLALSGRESRERTKFVESIAEEVKESELVRLEVIKKYAEMDEDTKELVLKEENGSQHYVIPDEKLPLFQEEIAKYMDEDFVISGEGNRQRLRTIKSVVLDTQEKIEGDMAIDYDKWCEAFEKVEV